MPFTAVHLVRHGEVHNPDGILYGRIPSFHLSERGRAMAEAVALHFQQEGNNIVHLVSSPLERARETAAPLAEALGLDPVLDERVLEARNHLEGRRINRELLRDRSMWKHFRNPVRPSWGEPYAEISDRMAAAVHAARSQAELLWQAGHGTPGRPAEAVIVSHQLPIWISRLSAERRRLWHDPRSRECSLASVTTVLFDGDRIMGVSYSEPAAHLLPGTAGVPGA